MWIIQTWVTSGSAGEAPANTAYRLDTFSAERTGDEAPGHPFAPQPTGCRA